MTYSPKPGAGWLPASKTPSTWGLMLEEGNAEGPSLMVRIRDEDVFEIAYSPRIDELQLPMPLDIQRVEIDFGVEAWSIIGHKVTDDDEDHCLVLRAVRVKD